MDNYHLWSMQCTFLPCKNVWIHSSDGNCLSSLALLRQPSYQQMWLMKRRDDGGACQNWRPSSNGGHSRLESELGPSGPSRAKRYTVVLKQQQYPGMRRLEGSWKTSMCYGRPDRLMYIPSVLCIQCPSLDKSIDENDEIFLYGTELW